MSDRDGDRAFSPAVLSKARAALLDGRVMRDSQAPSVYWIEGVAQPAGFATPPMYRVQVGRLGTGERWATCECPWGVRQGRGRMGCYHVAAALLLEGDDLG